MASVRKETVIDAPPEEVWDALRDFGALHERLVPGFAVEARLDGEYRTVTFFNGAVARERLVDRDDAARRLVWSVVDGPYTHHNASAQVCATEDGRTRFVWVADLLPHALGPRVDALMERGTATLRATLSAPRGDRRRRTRLVWEGDDDVLHTS